MNCGRKNCKNKLPNKIYTWVYKTNKVDFTFCSEQCLTFKFPKWTNK